MNLPAVPADAAALGILLGGLLVPQVAVTSWFGACVWARIRGSRGSLKCASLRQALTSLDAETSVVALVDADAVVHPDWLSTMVDECTRPAVGAVSGNRWFDPGTDSVAGVVRAVWNAGAVVQMTICGVPWGGSLAMRREAMEACRWLDVIETSLCEDTSLAAPFAAAGWRYRYVPALTVVDQDDDVSLRSLTRWIARQMLTARLHHPSWPIVATHGLSTSLALAAALVGLVAAAATARHRSLVLIAGALLAYQAVSFLMLLAVAAAKWFGSFTRGPADDTRQPFFSPGMHVMVTRSLALGVRVGWGLTADAAPFFSDAGLGWCWRARLTRGSRGRPRPWPLP